MNYFKVWSVGAAAYLSEVFWFYSDAEDAGRATGYRFVIEPGATSKPLTKKTR